MRRTIVATVAATAITFGGVGVALPPLPKPHPAPLSWRSKHRTSTLTAKTATRPDYGGSWAWRACWVSPDSNVETTRPCAPTSGPTRRAAPESQPC